MATRQLQPPRYPRLNLRIYQDNGSLHLSQSFHPSPLSWIQSYALDEGMYVPCINFSQCLQVERHKVVNIAETPWPEPVRVL
ncbi:hypothetical protein N7449_008460 [Penicillium cf. viridicatum]|uniref:Uncharacterized protein n=1 Tax=Penicillium cf. viridicatum TaxID=2972119 RepID=A0A9W9J917_9EURO|nr:hypothetical protein N7449_008460 [Penicillium cf. viridicatum]